MNSGIYGKIIEVIEAIIERLKISIPIKGKSIIITILFLSAIIVFKPSVDHVRKKAMDNRLIVIAKGSSRVKLCKLVEVELIDITTLQDTIEPSRPGLEYNLNLSSDHSHVEYIHKRVFERAGVANPNKAAEKIWEMDQKEWEDFLDDQDEYTHREIKSIPFARLRIYIDVKIDQNFENYYFFKGEEILVETVGKGSPTVRFRLEHVYDTSEGSGEPDTVTVRVLR